MTVRSYLKRPLMVRAVEWRPDDEFTVNDVIRWLTDSGCSFGISADGRGLDLVTREGTMRADPGDFVIRGVAGEFYPCKPAIFAHLYEPVP